MSSTIQIEVLIDAMRRRYRAGSGLGELVNRLFYAYVVKHYKYITDELYIVNYHDVNKWICAMLQTFIESVTNKDIVGILGLEREAIEGTRHYRVSPKAVDAHRRSKAWNEVCDSALAEWHLAFGIYEVADTMPLERVKPKKESRNIRKDSSGKSRIVLDR